MSEDTPLSEDTGNDPNRSNSGRTWHLIIGNGCQFSHFVKHWLPISCKQDNYTFLNIELRLWKQIMSAVCECGISWSYSLTIFGLTWKVPLIFLSCLERIYKNKRHSSLLFIFHMLPLWSWAGWVKQDWQIGTNIIPSNFCWTFFYKTHTNLNGTENIGVTEGKIEKECKMSFSIFIFIYTIHLANLKVYTKFENTGSNRNREIFDRNFHWRERKINK